jgi:phosphate transport system substrate-binding protein
LLYHPVWNRIQRHELQERHRSAGSPVSAEKGGEAIEPSIANVQNKTYPIARPLYIYTVGEPDPDSTVGKYLAWIKGEGGQESRLRSGIRAIKLIGSRTPLPTATLPYGCWKN